MICRSQYIARIIGHHAIQHELQAATVFAPSNIALCKYWGKRSIELNLPVTDSLSISLQDYGALTTLEVSDTEDALQLNNHNVIKNNIFYNQVFDFLNLFRNKEAPFFNIKTKLNIPASAGLASSACGFAALTLALNRVFNWQLSEQQLSLIARLGSGSACRSLWHGFVHWHRGVFEDGLDSYATVLPYHYPQMRVGLILCDTSPKKYSSRQAMIQTVNYSRLYKTWPLCVEEDLKLMFESLEEGNLTALFSLAERNCKAMHATLMDLPESISYSTIETYQIIQHIRSLRDQGLPVYYTQDAGPNIKLLFEADYEDVLKKEFKEMIIVKPFV